MKLFSNFDTNVKANCIEENAQQYGEENVLCLSKSGLYFFVKIVRPLIWLTILDVVLIVFFFWVFDYSYLALIIIVAFLVSSPFLISLIARYIDYKMDFLVVNPDSVIQYDQTGVFTKKLVTINEKSIKSVTVDKKGFLYSMFDNGDLTFFSEGDELHGDIVLHYVSQPEKKRHQIEKIMNKA